MYSNGMVAACCMTGTMDQPHGAMVRFAFLSPLTIRGAAFEVSRRFSFLFRGDHAGILFPKMTSSVSATASTMAENPGWAFTVSISCAGGTRRRKSLHFQAYRPDSV